MYSIKNVAKRGSALLAAASLLAGIGASALPGFASADSLNPLTERSLTLSSSSPGWSYLDGSGNTKYAPPHSGANGQKTGETFSFRMSSFNKTIRAMTFQFCTTPAGVCTAPGDDGYNPGLNNTTFPADYADDTRNLDSATTSDLNVATGTGSKTPLEIDSSTWPTIAASANKTPLADSSQGTFVVLHGDESAGSADSYGDGTWSMAAGKQETYAVSAHNPDSDPAINATGKNNLITITSPTGQDLNTTTGGDYFKVIFFGTDDNYITNPGSGAFFVRMNTYSSDTLLDSDHLVDGGVTVANMMNESISIQTKVLETMQFSVGTYDPDMYSNTRLATDLGLPAHGQCSSLLMADPNGENVTDHASYLLQPHNVLHLGNPDTEYALDTGVAYATQSYWRLSSNSSGGATVYYTGHTLTNTENDAIAPMNDTTSGGTSSNPGTEQFGLAIDHGSANMNVGPGGSSVDTLPVDESAATPYGSAGTPGDFADFVDKGSDGIAGHYDDSYAHLPRLYPLGPSGNYGGGNGTIVSGGTAKFAFNANADTYAQAIATESTQVVNCVTAKMRYIANIAATTPAGIYTTKINYVAAPQY